MVEENADPVVVTMQIRRESEEAKARADEEAQYAAAVDAAGVPQSSVGELEVGTAAVETVPPPEPPRDAGAALRHARLGMLAVLGLVLFLVWIRQRRT